MKNLATVVAAIVLAAILLLYMCTFQVRFTETAIRKTWGKPEKDAIVEPGLYFKWPRPIQTVVVYDKRVRVMETRTEETRTVDGKNLVLTTYALWRIKDPAMFHTNFPGGVEDGENKLRTTINTNKHSVVGKRSFAEFVSTDEKERKIRDIEKEILAAVARDAMTFYGVEVVDFGVKKLALPQSVTAEIFGSMKANEEAKAKRYVAEGEARARDILANAGAVEQRILAEARRKASAIQTDAQRVVSEYYKEFNTHPELRIFLDKLRTVRDALQSRTTLILDTERAPWDLFDPKARERIPLANDDRLAIPDPSKSPTNREP